MTHKPARNRIRRDRVQITSVNAPEFL